MVPFLKRLGMVWCGPWLGIESWTPTLDASTLPLGYQGDGVNLYNFAWNNFDYKLYKPTRLNIYEIISLYVLIYVWMFRYFVFTNTTDAHVDSYRSTNTDSAFNFPDNIC